MLSKKTAFWAILFLLATATTVVAGLYVRSHLALREGEKLLKAGILPQARERIRTYLQMHPRSGKARMMMAEAFVKDVQLDPEDAAKKANQHLALISERSDFAGEARLQQARLTFLILGKPAAAERLVEEALELKADRLAAKQLHWTIHRVTGRSELSEPLFWAVYEATPPQQRGAALRDWYMSQFFPIVAAEPLDQMMGVLGENEPGTQTSVSRRLLRFRQLEPRAPVNHAALVNWCHQEGDMEFAELLVNTASKELEGAHDSPFFLAAEIAVAFDLGEFDRAKQRLAEWPESDRSHPYWMWKAIILDEVDGESEQAIVPYQKALEIWPGPMDWRLRFRLAACLTRLQRIEDAEKQRQRAKQIQELLSQERHAKIRDALGYLDDPQRLQVVVEFYNELGRPKEAQAWTEYIQSLRE